MEAYLNGYYSVAREFGTREKNVKKLASLLDGNGVCYPAFERTPPKNVKQYLDAWTSTNFFELRLNLQPPRTLPEIEFPKPQVETVRTLLPDGMSSALSHSAASTPRKGLLLPMEGYLLKMC